MIIRDLLLAIPVVIVGWLAVLVGVGFLTDVAPARVVVFPRAELLGDMPPEVAVTGASSVSLTLTSEAPDFARMLLRNGAWLALPAGLPGCAGPLEDGEREHD